MSPYLWPPAHISPSPCTCPTRQQAQLQPSTVMSTRDISKLGLALGLGSPLRMMSCHPAPSCLVINPSLQTYQRERLQSFCMAEPPVLEEFCVTDADDIETMTSQKSVYNENCTLSGVWLSQRMTQLYTDHPQL